ncbi:MAG: AAA family ATPase [Mariprofundus sp.]
MADALDQLTIRGFKSIRELNGFELKSLNLFIGGNGVGKSNLISFFRLLRDLVDGKFNRYIKDAGGVSDLLYNGRKVTQKMEFEVRFGVRGYRFNIEPGPSEDALLTGEARYYQPGASGWWGLGDSPDGTSRLVREVTANGADSQYSKPVYSAISSWQIYHFHDTSATAAMRHYEIVQDNKALRFNASNIAPYLLSLRAKEPRVYADILNAVHLVMPFFDDFLLDIAEFGEKQKVNLSWRQKESDFPMQPYHLSDGSIRFICLAVALLQPHPPSTIIIDEPELGLHPEAIAVLAELIQDASTRTQVIVATQSPALINYFSIDDLVVVSRKNGQSTFERLNANDFAVWLEDYSVGELWTKNVIAGGPVYE